MKFLEKIKDLWTRFRTWQIGECTDPAGMGNMQISNEFFKGTVHSTMPIFDGVTANTALQLLFRPGYMIREYLRGKHDNVLSPMAALIIFFAFGMILNNMFGSEPVNYSEVLTQAQERLASEETADDPAIAQKAILLLDKISAVYRFFNMDQFPDTIHTRTERVIAGIEDWIRSQGVFTFIVRLLLLTLGLWSVGRKPYRLSYSAAATIAAFMLCQRCIYEFFFTLFSLGTHQVPIWLVFLLLWLNIYQLLGVSWKKIGLYGKSCRDNVRLPDALSCLLWSLPYFIHIHCIIGRKSCKTPSFSPLGIIFVENAKFFIKSFAM